MEELLKFKFGRTPVQQSGNIGLRQLREQRDQTVERWSRLGFLDGLVGYTQENSALFFDAQTSYIINEDISQETYDIPFRFR